MNEQVTMQELLNEEISTLFARLEKLTPGTEEYEKTNDELVKLMDRAIKMESFAIENANKQKAMDDENKDRAIKNTLTGVSIIGGFALTVWGTVKSIKFEETGTFTTIMGRGFINKLLPKK